jgi:putative ABC transport system permease protein
MLTNYLIVTLRALLKRPGYTALNVFGLGLGLAGCFLIVLFIQHERSFDRFHENADRIHRLIYARGEDPQRYATTGAGFAGLLQERFPEVERVIRVEQNRMPHLRLPNGEMRQAGVVTLADDGFFEVFSFPLLHGRAEEALDDPRSIVLTETSARSLFGDADPIGQTVGWGDQFDLTVSAVAADPPENSTVRFDMVAPFRLLTQLAGPNALEDFTNFNYMTYVLLHAHVDRAALEERAVSVARERFGENSNYRPIFQPLMSLHFDRGVMFDYASIRNPRYLYVFGAIGLLILLLACVNFTNLATARATQRAKEVGVRKTLGSGRRELIGQFLGESVLLALVATMVGLGMAALAAPAFNEAINSTAGVRLAQPALLALLLAIGVAAGVLAGSYPAFYLSAFRPASVLKGDLSLGRGTPRLRRGLVVFQFAATAFMLVATITVYRQLGYMQTHDLGFDQEHVITVRPPAPIRQRYDAFRQELLSSPHVAAVSRGNVPGAVRTNRGYNWPGGAEDSEQGSGFWTLIADPDHRETLGLELVAGRWFIESEADEQDAYILNETLTRQLGWTPKEAVGQPFRAWDRPMGQVVGVARDFNFQSLHSAVEPVVMNYKPDWLGSEVAVRLAPGHLPSALADVRAHWETFAPGYAFEYTFLDEVFGELYRSEQRLGRLFGLFAGLAVLIACLGLFGLAAYSAEQRTREIGVRKVLGARPAQLVGLLSKDFARLVVIGVVIASPVAYWAMSRWLEAFAYRVELGPGVFLAAGLLALAIALVTVSSLAYRAATTDPINALRSD